MDKLLKDLFKDGDTLICASHYKDAMIFNGHLHKVKDSYWGYTKGILKVCLLNSKGELAENLSRPISAADYQLIQLELNG